MTIDEELHASYIGWIPGWNAQGRWGMGLLSAFVVPTSVVPTVSVLIGVCVTLIAIYLIMKDAFQLDDMAATLVAALAITVPTLSYTFTFSTIAYGVGIGFAVLAAAYFLILSGDWRRLLFASALAGFSIGIYQTFIVVILLVAVLTIWKQVNLEGFESVRSAIVKSTLFVFGAVAIYSIVDLVSRKLLKISLQYVGGFINIISLTQSPWKNFVASINRTLDLLVLSSQHFGISSPWLSIAVLFAILIVVFYKLKSRSVSHKILLSLIIVLAWFLCILADVISVGGAPTRSVIYLPVVVGLTVAAGYSRGGKSSTLLLSLIVILSIVGNSVISNHLFASNAYAERLDNFLATEILQEIKQIRPDTSDSNVLRLEVIGKQSWPASNVMTKSETFGASFFEWDDGNRYRVAAYLRTWGINVVGATDEDRAKVFTDVQKMPSWPTPGWVQIRDGVLVVKLSNYTPSQKSSMLLNGDDTTSNAP